MIEIKGKYTNAIIYQEPNYVEESCISQIQTLIDSPAYENCKVRVMPDCHTGVSATIGFTSTIVDKVIPATVGVDIGCGMLVAKLEGIRYEDINFSDFDNFIKTHIPAGREVYESRQVHFPEILNLKCYRELNDAGRFEKAIGTLGGGNHFMELDQGSDGSIYFVVHTGSRNMGKQVADYYQNLADGLCNRGLDTYFVEKAQLIERYKTEGRKSEIQSALKELAKKYKETTIEKVPKDLAWLEGSHLEDYLHDMVICQWYATLNRKTICEKVVKYFGLDWTSVFKFQTVHNYIDLEQKMLRKGAIDCSSGEIVLIPINMRDGSIIAYGKGNPDYNFSGPHGAGRLMSRNQAKESISLDDFKKSMEGIYTSCVSEDTLDESPMAYKSIESVLPWIEETAEVVDIIKPIWNYKAKE